MTYLVVIVFGLIVGGTGPSYRDWRRRRRELRDRPRARLLPAGAGHSLKYEHGMPVADD